MNICVFAASSNFVDDKYKNAARDLGVEMAKRGHSLVFGAGEWGLMGACAHGVADAGGKVIGVTPKFFDVDGIVYHDCDELIYTETMRERKAIMEDLAEAYVVAPGGIGTYEEFYEVLTLKQLGVHGRAIVIFNVDGYYDKMLEMMKHSETEGFMVGATNRIYEVMTDVNEILDYIENYQENIGQVYKFLEEKKKGV